MDQSHHSKSKGDLGVLKAQLYMFEQGPVRVRIECVAEGRDDQERSVEELPFATDYRRAP